MEGSDGATPKTEHQSRRNCDDRSPLLEGEEKRGILRESIIDSA